MFKILKNQINIFRQMIRRSLQLIALWFCLAVPFFEYYTDPTTSLKDTLALWVCVIYPVLFLTVGMIRQNLDAKQNELNR